MTSVDALCQRVVLVKSAQTLHRVIHIGADGSTTTDENDIAALYRKGLRVKLLGQFVKRILANARVMLAAVLGLQFWKMDMDSVPAFAMTLQSLDMVQQQVGSTELASRCI